jgi:MerC mercury resistance protein
MILIAFKNTNIYFATMLLFNIFVVMLKFRINWDALGVGASLACAIHCALLPLFLSSLPLFGINIIGNIAFELSMIGLALAIGSLALYHGYKKHHHNRLPLTLFFIGFFFLVLKQFFVLYENWLLLPAVTFIVLAHLLNYRFCRRHDHAHSAEGEH